MTLTFVKKYFAAAGRNSLHHYAKNAAFSLVEMLMALLVASLLMAALAPVMTKRMDEAKLNISGVGAAQYDKDAIISIYTGAADEDKVFNVPNDVNMIKATLIGGGGAGGNSFYGKQEVTTSKSWVVPEGVTKLRIFMLGGGGGGASGGLGTGTATIPAGGDGNTYKDFLTEGEHAFTIPSSATKVPDLDPACAASGLTAWTGVSDGQEYTPGKVAVSVTACGGGGGGGDRNYATCFGTGGNGGYMENAQIAGSLPSTVYITIGGGGGTSSYNKSYQSTANGGYGAGGAGGSPYISSSNSSASGSGGKYAGDGGSFEHTSSSQKNITAGNGGSGKIGALGASGGSGGTYTDYSYTGGQGGSGSVYGGGGDGGGQGK